MIPETHIIYLRRAAICFIITGVGYLIFSFPFWFLGAVDEGAKGKLILPFLFLVDDLFPMDWFFWHGPVATAAMFIGAFSLWKVGEPTGFGKRLNFLYISMAGAISYFLGQWMPLPFAPLGALLTGLGMILVGVASLKANVWTGWKRYIPLIVGCFPFLFMFPLLIITGNRPAAVIGFWGIPWIVLGITAWQRASEVKYSLSQSLS